MSKGRALSRDGHAIAPLMPNNAHPLLLSCSQRFLQYLLRFYIYVKVRTSRGAPYKITRLLVVVIGLSLLRKVRTLSELLLPFVNGEVYDRLSSITGTSAFPDEGSAPPSSTGLGWSNYRSPSYAASNHETGPASHANVSSTPWYWTEKHAWAANPQSPPATAANDGSPRATALPPVSDDASVALRYRLSSLETTLSLLDTLADGVAMLARLGITVTIPFKFLGRLARKPAPSPVVTSPERRSYLKQLFARSETMADIFWLLSTLISLVSSEWERREVWSFGRRVRRLMKEEEAELARVEERFSHSLGEEVSHDETGGAGSERDGSSSYIALEEAERMQRIRAQRRALRDLRGRLNWLWWERLRLIADAVFATYDVFEWSTGSEGVRAVAGAVSASIGFSQVSRRVVMGRRAED